MTRFDGPVFFLAEKNGKRRHGGNQGPDGRKAQGGNLPESDLGKEIIGSPEDGGQNQIEIGGGKTLALDQNNPGKKIKPALRGLRLFMGHRFSQKKRINPQGAKRGPPGIPLNPPFSKGETILLPLLKGGWEGFPLVGCRYDSRSDSYRLGWPNNFGLLLFPIQ